jgi:hypothetical protein
MLLKLPETQTPLGPEVLPPSVTKLEARPQA